MTHLVVIAGEESGDLHAAEFIHTLKNRNPNLKITGIGGQHMQTAGAELISDLARHAVTGVVEVLRHIRLFYRGFRQIKAHLKATKPDLLVLVDYPGFNLRLLKYVKTHLNLKIIYYISPQIWAWKPKRIRLIQNYVDHMAVILPFEKDLYQKAQVPVSFVGHPLVNKVPSNINQTALQSTLNIPQGPRIVALLPGSRRNEVQHLMPVLKAMATILHQAQPNLHFVIPIAPSLNQQLIQAYLHDVSFSYSLIAGHAIDTMSCSDVVVVASGTASLECALLGKPMCIIYKAPWFTYYVATKLMRVKFLGLCNLLQNKMIVPEFLQYDCNAPELARAVTALLNHPPDAAYMITQLQQLKLGLSQQQADQSIAQLIEQNLHPSAAHTILTTS